MAAFLTWVFGTLFGIWILATILFQFPKFQPILSRFDLLTMLPTWSFFAPSPNTSDYTLFVRYWTGNNHVTGWRTILTPEHHRISFLWDPGRRYRKIIIDISQSFIEFVKMSSHKGIQYSTPYLLVLHHASSRPEAAFATGVQFAVGVQRGKCDDFELLFQSHFHRIQPAPASRAGRLNDA
jgi:hypothetical protein